MIIGEVILEHVAEVASVKYDHMIQALTADGADESLDDRILPRTTRRNHLLLQSNALHFVDECFPVNAVPVS
jgi:hypothetical protein